MVCNINKGWIHTVTNRARYVYSRQLYLTCYLGKNIPRDLGTDTYIHSPYCTAGSLFPVSFLNTEYVPSYSSQLGWMKNVYVCTPYSIL